MVLEVIDFAKFIISVATPVCVLFDYAWFCKHGGIMQRGNRILEQLTFHVPSVPSTQEGLGMNVSRVLLLLSIDLIYLDPILDVLSIARKLRASL